MIIFPLILHRIIELFHKCEPASPAPPPAPPVLTEAEIDAKLARIAQWSGQTKLDWKNSITDLLVLLQIPNLYHYRGGLYVELGGEGDYKGTAEQNVWLIKRVRQMFADGEIAVG